MLVHRFLRLKHRKRLHLLRVPHITTHIKLLSHHFQNMHVILNKRILLHIILLAHSKRQRSVYDRICVKSDFHAALVPLPWADVDALGLLIGFIEIVHGAGLRDNLFLIIVSLFLQILQSFPYFHSADL